MKVSLWVIVDKSGHIVYSGHIEQWCYDYMKNHAYTLEKCNYGELKIIELKGEF